MIESSPIISAIERMFSNELAGPKWRSLKVEDISFLYDKYTKETILEYTQSGRKFGPPISILHVKIAKKLKSFKTTTDQVVYLNERMQ